MKQRLLELDGCRGLLCWSVVAGHWLGSRLGWGNVNFSHSYISVDGFFILSGIVLTYIYKLKFTEGKGEIFKYALHRFERLYPLHLLTFLLSVFIYNYFFESIPFKDPTLTGFYNLTLVHGLGFASSWNWNDPSWSISVEFYASILIFPLLLKTRSNNTLIALAIFSYSLVYARHHNLEAATDLNLYIFSSGFLKCVAGMSLGVSIINSALNGEAKKKSDIKTLITQTTAIIFLAYFIFTKDNIASYDSIAILSFYYIFYSLIKYNTVWNRFFSSQILVYFGNISFAIYLFHTPLMLILDQIESFTSLNLYGQSVVFISVLIASCHIIYNHFEMPIYRSSKKITDGILAR